jgi:hypothetical protein
MRLLWNLLNQPFVRPQRFDAIENAEIPFTERSYKAGAELYDREGYLFVRGAQDSFLAALSRHSRQLTTLSFYLDAKALRGKTERVWLDWLFAVCEAFPVLFGYAATSEEYKAKHQMRKPMPDGTRVTEWLGISISEFARFLPGVYWLTFFGPELVQHFGPRNLMHLPNTRAFSIGATQIAVCLDEPVKPSNMEDRLRIEATIAERLGKQFFFDRNHPEAELQPVPALQAALTGEW